MSLESHLLARLAVWREAPAWRVAFSGGLDSSVLLHLLVQASRHNALPPISAIHVHHGLQAAADAWPAHCQRLCDELGVSLSIQHVQVEPGASLERAAREARYGAFAAALNAGEVLLLAQHQDDQAETVLYRLLRGAGVQGLAAMADSRPLADGHAVRPLLGVPRSVLEAYAAAHGLLWVDDPSNTDTGLARNFLRQEILPRLQRHWPKAAQVLARAAEHQAEAQGLLQALAELDMQHARGRLNLDWLDIPCLDLQALRQLSDARQRNLLRYWLADFTRLPDSRHWQGWHDLRDAAADASPIWRLERGELRRHGGSLLWLDARWRAPWSGQLQPWSQVEQPLLLPGNGRVWLEGVVPAGQLSIGYRQGGEILDVPGRGRRDLKRLLQEAGVPEFIRGRIPLLLCDGRLVAVANLLASSGCGKLHWHPPEPESRQSVHGNHRP
ncbi:tRNA lysidine(34) synthetase TilS [Pseudomonas daroniae]|uniref:tRNA(Ile)-lysidine synthase n=1 Tax=Phytopseudomonas daroniae TaxID=2487519 RepID=A0A4V2KAL5_9GAMM|nr:MULTISPECIES: tRNA lysidine(34) synthetase TilS [Pseudomonas]TBU77667.1 tRNA lysidine(34) synthetase TilS [Pseudomonas daroniae]TBU85819.1 tRNA lysidine(34) synthetase TilS [Pseudomonas sp. FRB 228]TBU94981.1 tRNA lysidine(34) synthetase TilS [Pseudomonas daroniae]